MNTNLITLQQLENVYNDLMVNLSDTEEHSILLDNLLDIIEDLEYEFENML